MTLSEVEWVIPDLQEYLNSKLKAESEKLKIKEFLDF
jgi:hypothetical protein